MTSFLGFALSDLLLLDYVTVQCGQNSMCNVQVLCTSANPLVVDNKALHVMQRHGP